MEDTPLRESEGMLNPYAADAVADAELRLDVEALKAENKELDEKLIYIRKIVKEALYHDAMAIVKNDVVPPTVKRLASFVYEIIDGYEAVEEYRSYLALQKRLHSEDPVISLEARLEILEKQIREQGQA